MLGRDRNCHYLPAVDNDPPGALLNDGALR